MKNGKEIKCRTCDKYFYVRPSLLKSGRKKYCSKQCLYKGDSYTKTFQKGHKDFVPMGSRGHTQETKDKIRKTLRDKNKNRVKNLIKTKERDYKKKIRMSFQWEEWRKSIFERDDYTCQECKIRGGKLEPHHIIPIRSDMSKLFELTNGITLCRQCHMKTFWRELDFAEKYIAIVAAQM